MGKTSSILVLTHFMSIMREYLLRNTRTELQGWFLECMTAHSQNDLLQDIEAKQDS